MVTGYAIEARGLRKSYGDVDVLEGVDLSVRRGTMFALLGPNGAGKTTTVRILSTLLDADGGTTILRTTQYLEEADQLADRIAVIDKGRVVAEGTAAELKRKVGTERLKLTFATAAEAARAHGVAGGVLIDDTVSIAIDQP